VLLETEPRLLLPTGAGVAQAEWKNGVQFINVRHPPRVSRAIAPGPFALLVACLAQQLRSPGKRHEQLARQPVLRRYSTLACYELLRHQNYRHPGFYAEFDSWARGLATRPGSTQAQFLSSTASPKHDWPHVPLLHTTVRHHAVYVELTEAFTLHKLEQRMTGAAAYSSQSYGCAHKRLSTRYNIGMHLLNLPASRSLASAVHLQQMGVYVVDDLVMLEHFK
jgi:hypothetical protein